MIDRWKASWTIIDAKRYTSGFVIYFHPEDEFGGVLEAIEQVTGLLKVITNGAVVSCNISASVRHDTAPFELPSDANVVSDVEDGGEITYYDQYRLTPFKQRIPTLKEEYYIAGTNEIDLESGEIDTLTGWMTIVDFPSTGAFATPRTVNFRGDRMIYYENGRQVFKPRK